MFLRFLKKIFSDHMEVTECKVIKTKKNKEEIKKYYEEMGYVVTGISECTRIKNEKVPII